MNKRLKRNEIASLNLGVLNARICGAKYKCFKKESITSYSSFTLQAIISLMIA